MANQKPTKPTKPPKNNPGDADTHQQPGYSDEDLRAIRTQIKRSIVSIGQQCNSKLAHIVLAYVPCVSPTMADRGVACFPRPLQQHPVNPDRSSYISHNDLLCFHIGNAIAAFHDAVNGGEAYHLHARVQQLQELAENGPRQFVSYGNTQSGYILVYVDAAAKQRQAHQE